MHYIMGGGTWIDWAILFSSLTGLVSVVLFLWHYGRQRDEKDEQNANVRALDAALDDEGVRVINANNNNNNINNADDDNNNINFNFNMTKKQLHKHEKKRLKSQHKEAYLAYLKMKKEKDEEKLRTWREKYGNSAESDDDGDDYVDGSLPSASPHSPSINRAGRRQQANYERFQLHTKDMTDFIQAEMRKTDVLVISKLETDLSLDTETCHLLLQTIEGLDGKQKGVFIDNNSKYLVFSDKFTNGLNEFILTNKKIDGNMLDTYISDYIKQVL